MGLHLSNKIKNKKSYLSFQKMLGLGELKFVNFSTFGQTEGKQQLSNPINFIAYFIDKYLY